MFQFHKRAFQKLSTKSKRKRNFFFNSLPKTPKIEPDLESRDPFAFLQDKTDPRVVEYIDKENNYTFSVMVQLKEIRKMTEDQLTLFNEEFKLKIGSFEKAKGYVYLQVQFPNQLPIYYRKKGEEKDLKFYSYQDIKDNRYQFEVVLDQNEVYNSIKPEPEYFEINRCKLSEDQSLLCYLIDIKGEEKYDLYIKDIQKERVFDKILNLPIVNAEFSNQEGIIYYTLADELKRSYQVIEHKFGDHPSKDRVIFTEKDDQYFVDVNKTKDNKYVLINVNSKNQSEVYYINEKGEPILIFKRQDNIHCFLEHNNGFFYALTNKDSLNYKLSYTSTQPPYDWKDFIPAENHLQIEDLDMFKDHIVLYEKLKANSRIRIVNLQSKETTLLDPPEKFCSVYPGMNSNFDSNVSYFSYSTPLQSQAFGEINLNKGNIENIRSQQEPWSKLINSSQYKIYRVIVPSHDGVEVPMTLVHHKNIELNSNNPVVIYGYGAYGSTLEVDFETQRLILLKNGFILAFAHVRGGGELGKEWHEEGKVLKKMNSFHDFNYCIEYLISKGYTNPSLVCAKGSSAGGLLVAASMNLRPDLYQSIILKVPFLDVYKTMIDSSLPLTKHEYDEWGNPSDPNVRELIKSYSPYQNLKKGKLPNVLITTSFNDFRAPYWNSLKYIAKYRQVSDNKTIGMIKVNDYGHFDDATGLNKFTEGNLTEYSFVFHTLKIKNNPKQ